MWHNALGKLLFAIAILFTAFLLRCLTTSLRSMCSFFCCNWSFGVRCWQRRFLFFWRLCNVRRSWAIISILRCGLFALYLVPLTKVIQEIIAWLCRLRHLLRCRCSRLLDQCCKQKLTLCHTYVFASTPLLLHFKSNL